MRRVNPSLAEVTLILLLISFGSICAAADTDIKKLIKNNGALKLTPELVVNLVLNQGTEAKKIKWETEKTQTELFLAETFFEPTFGGGINYTDSKAETLNLSSTTESQTLGVDINLTKNFSTGSALTWSYSRNSQQSIPTSLTGSTSPTSQTLDTMKLELTQSLIRNGFGSARRKLLDRGLLIKESGDLQQLEDLEALVLEAMKIFWDAYVAKENLKKSIAARDRYSRLVSIVRKKSKLGFTGPGELSRIQAEFETQVQQVKKRSAAYLNMVDQLEIQLKATLPDEIEFSVAQQVPPLPKLKEKRADSLRPFLIARSSLKQAELNLSAADSQTKPLLNLVLATSFTGLDEDAPEALSEVTGATKPIYYAGLQWEAYLGNKTELSNTQTLSAEKEVRKLNLVSVRDQLEYDLVAHERLAQSELMVAQSAIRSVVLRRQSSKEIERAYRQGRQTISELIQNLDKLFESETAQTRAIGDYHIALNQWAATRDELILSTGQPEPK